MIDVIMSQNNSLELFLFFSNPVLNEESLILQIFKKKKIQKKSVFCFKGTKLLSVRHLRLKKRGNTSGKHTVIITGCKILLQFFFLPCFLMLISM